MPEATNVPSTLLDDHAFEPCGAGTKTNDQACLMVREYGGNRDLCHHVYDSADGFCQEPSEAHRG